MNEVDPNGKSANEPGAKLDAGKVRPALVIQGFRRALLAISEVGTFGAAKYTDNGWKSVPDGRKRYEDALYRHLLAEGVDEQSGLPHLAHAAWNILAILELEQQRMTLPIEHLAANGIEIHVSDAISGLKSKNEAIREVVAGAEFTAEELGLIDLQLSPCEKRRAEWRKKDAEWARLCEEHKTEMEKFLHEPIDVGALRSPPFDAPKENK